MKILSNFNKQMIVLRAANRGFTMVELLIALLLAGLITSASIALYITQNKQFMVQDEVSNMQANIRAASSEMAEKIRMAGYNVPAGLLPIVAHNTNPDTIDLIYDSSELNDVQLESPMPQPSAELRCDGHDLTGLHNGDWAYIYDPSTRTGEYFLATDVQLAPAQIQHNSMPLSRAYPIGSKILKLDLFKFYIDLTDVNHPTLMIKQGFGAAQPYADNITNLNFSYVLSSGATIDMPTIPEMIREVIINVDARNDKADNEFQTQYRTRTLTTRVKVRNLATN
jgi:prepilin-type N-terminal cleavage/methylation domain-containing protein